MGEQKSRRNGIQKSVLFLLVSAVYLLLFSAFTSPLFPKFLKYDSAVFMMVGKSILAGKKLYVDIFDHKGPILHWLEAIGMAGGRIGVFLIQTAFLWVDLLLLDRMAGLFFDETGEERTKTAGRKYAVKRWFVIGMTLLLLSYPLANGNLTEEYSLPFIFLALYLFLKDMDTEGEPGLCHSYVYGICFGILAFIRLNNAVTICAVILYWMIVLIKEKRWKTLLLHLGVGLLGIATVTLPILLYFFMSGSLYEMIYAVFLFNFRYGTEGGFLRRLASLNTWAHLIILFAPLVLAMLVFGTRIRNGRLKAALELILVLNMLSLFLGQGYNHYFTITVPLEALMLICLASRRENETDRKAPQAPRQRYLELFIRIGFAGVAAVYSILAVRIIVLNVKDYYVDDTVRREYEVVQDCLSDIPDGERDAVLGYLVPAEYYLMGEIIPCFRYAVLQESWGSVDAEIMEDTLQYLSGGGARWIIMTTEEYSDQKVPAILEEDYEIVKENDYCRLYRRKME